VYERARRPGVTGVTLHVAPRSYGMDRDSELELVRQVRAGDTDAFDAAHALFNAPLFGFLARLAGNRDLAEDLLEETWLRFVAYADRLEPDTRLGPWLFAVARNLHISYCRSRAVETSHADAGIGLWPTIVPDSPFEHAVGDELGRRLEAAIADLPVAFREVLLLVAVEGLRPAEAADVCGISPEALRQRLKRARALLQDRLGESRTSRGIREVHHVVPRTTRSNP
jgi:RNA polymerase sigma-70 factor, ECF subfamily